MKPIPKVVILLLLGVAVFLIGVGSRTASSPSPPPCVTVTPANQELGELSRDRTVRATFQVKNTYSEAVTLGGIVKGCSCTDANFAADTIPPGGSTELSLTWALRGKRGRSNEAVSFPFTGPNGISGYLQARVNATVHGVIDPDLDVLELTTTDREGTVNFRSKIGRTFRITNVGTNHGSITAKVLPGDQSVRVTFDPSVSGWESGQLWLAALTDQVDEPEVKVWVRPTIPSQGAN